MTRTLSVGLLLVAHTLLSACANLPTKVRPVADSSTYVIDFGASRRGAYVRATSGDNAGTPRVSVCAEPSPDVAIALTANLQAQIGSGTDAGKTSAQASMSESIIDLAKRGQTLQIQREALYRLCELETNAGLDPKDAARLYENVLHSIQLLALTELGNSHLPEEAKKGIVDSILKGDFLKPKSE